MIFLFRETRLAVSKIDPEVIKSRHLRWYMITMLSQSISYHHILPLLRLQKHSESVFRTSWHPGYGQKLLYASLFQPGLLRCLIYLLLEGCRKCTKIGLSMGVTIGGDASKSGKNTHLLVIIFVRLLQKIGMTDLANHTQFKKGNSQKIRAKRFARLLQNEFNVT